MCKYFSHIYLLLNYLIINVLQNLRFYRAKEPLLERKTIGFVIR